MAGQVCYWKLYSECLRRTVGSSTNSLLVFSVWGLYFDTVPLPALCTLGSYSQSPFHISFLDQEISAEMTSTQY